MADTGVRGGVVGSGNTRVSGPLIAAFGSGSRPVIGTSTRVGLQRCSCRSGRTTQSFSRWLFLCILVLWVFGLTSCDNAGSAPPGVSPAVAAVVAAVWKLRNMGAWSVLRSSTEGDPNEEFITEVGQHVKFFLRLRAEAHLNTDPNEDKATQAVAAEYDLVRAFVSNVVGWDANSPAPLVAGTDKTPGHLDLSDVLRFRTADVSVSASKMKSEQLERWKRAMNIVWRAAALEPDVWDANFSEAGMMELLDRRLRITDRMLYQISADVSGDLQPSSANPHGPWLDGIRVRMFEYPILEQRYASMIGAGNIGPTGIWRPSFDGSELNYNEDNGRRIRGAAVAEFTPASGPDSYPYDFVPAGDPAQAIDHLFTPSENWWDRSWIFCDHVLAALHLESLRFGKRRREGNDNSFNAAVNSHTQGWAQLRPLLPGVLGDLRLMADDRAKPPSEPRLFANGPARQLQLGDHVVFWNSIMYGLLSDGAWSLENAIVIEVQSNWKKNDIGKAVKLMGHGTLFKDAPLSKFRELVTDGLNSMLDQARQRAKATAGDNVPWIRAAAPLVRWAPFGESWVDETGNAHAPWWIRVPYDPTADWQQRALGRVATLRTLPDAIEFDPGAGFASPPPAAGGGPANAAYFPLWWPAQAGKWKGYIQRRKSGEIPSKFRLEPVWFDKDNIPGLILPSEFVPGSDGPRVYTVRPFVVR